jgi:hypothetical protein
MSFELIDPKGLEPPVGYVHIAKITGGTVVYVLGRRRSMSGDRWSAKAIL